MFNFDVVFHASLSKQLIKQLSCQWCETPWHSCDIIVMNVMMVMDIIYLELRWKYTRFTIYLLLQMTLNMFYNPRKYKAWVRVDWILYVLLTPKMVADILVAPFLPL